jgi:nitrogen PTS system EIIA component
MTVGATLRLLRVESGMGLRAFARRLGVSSAYLSRVENGVDGAPTPERLEAMARALEVPATVLLDLAHQVSPLVVDYVASVPEAGTLFLEIAHLGLGPDQIAELRSWIRRTYGVAGDRWTSMSGVAPLLEDARIVLRFQGTDLEDLFDVIAGRLGAACGMVAAPIARVLAEREAAVSSAIGDGVAIQVVHAPSLPMAALVTLAKPMASQTPDGIPLSLVVVLFGTPADTSGFRPQIAQLARLAARGLARDLSPLTAPSAVRAHVAALEAHLGV